MSSESNSPPVSARRVCGLLFLLGVLILPWLGNTPFATRGEPREALVTQAMVVTGEWILPRGYGDDVPSKPPFMHWLGAGFSKLAGKVSEFTTRLPSALGAIGFAVALYVFLVPRAGERRALITVIVLATSLEWFRAATICRVDMTLTALLAGGLLALFRWSERGLRGVPWVAILLLTGATLTKGPVSIVLPGAIFAIYLVLKGESLGRVVGRALLAGLPIVVGAGLWYVAAWSEGGDDFIAKVLYENVDRFSGAIEDKPHAHSAFYLYVTVLIGFIPWTLFLLPTIVRRLVHGIRAGSPLRSLRQRWSAATDFERFACLVIFGFLLFFSIPTSKRAVYLLPAYPFMAFFVSGVIEGWTTGVVWRRCARVLSGAIVFLFGIVALYHFDFLDLGWFVKKPTALFDATFFGTHVAGIDFASAGPLFLVALGLCGLGVWLLVAPPAAPTAFSGFRVVAGLVGAVLLVVQAVVVPAVMTPLSLERVARDIAPLVPPQAGLYSFGTEFYGVSFYLEREIFRARQPLKPGDMILVLERNRGRLSEVLGSEGAAAVVFTTPYGVVKPRDRVSLVEVRAVSVAAAGSESVRSGIAGASNRELEEDE